MDSEQNQEIDADGIDRRGFLKCMAWAGTGVLWSVHGGLLRGTSLSGLSEGPASTLQAKADFSFVQISDSHIGFNKPANTDVIGTLNEAIAKIKALPNSPAFMLHTGDISHLSKPDEFDAVDQILKGPGMSKTFFVPGEHDVLDEGGKLYLDRYGKDAKGEGWYSFDVRGTHFVGLVNVVNLKAGGLGNLGAEQLEWLRKDLAPLSASTPIVVFAHIPLWTVYEKWGWGTGDAEQALSFLKRFGSVTVLNGHIHQVTQKVEGNITFHTACSTAFPQPHPGEAAGPGPMTVEPGKLRDLLGITSVSYSVKQSPLAVTDIPLSGAGAEGATKTITIDNFTFLPSTLSISAGAQVTWVNHDDIPHNIVSADGKFPRSSALDTNDKYSITFKEPGKYDYYCGMHPKMTGAVVVR